MPPTGAFEKTEIDIHSIGNVARLVAYAGVTAPVGACTAHSVTWVFMFTITGGGNVVLVLVVVVAIVVVDVVVVDTVQTNA